jgi:hypothetical protein
VFSPALCAMMGIKTELSHPSEDKIPDLSPKGSPYDVFFAASSAGRHVGASIPPYARQPAHDSYNSTYRASTTIGHSTNFIHSANPVASGTASTYAHQPFSSTFAIPTSIPQLTPSYPTLMPATSASRSVSMRSFVDTNAGPGFQRTLPPPSAVWRPQQNSVPTAYPPPTVGVKRPLVTTSTILPKGSRTPKRSRPAGAPPTPSGEGRGYKFGLSVKVYGTQIQHVEAAASTLGVDPQELVRYVLQSRIHGITKQDVRPFCS